MRAYAHFERELHFNLSQRGLPGAAGASRLGQ